MEISPIYWTILGEIALVFIGVLVAVIVVISKDRNKLKDYIGFLKETIQKQKQKLLDKENEQQQERTLELLKALVHYVHEEYASNYGTNIESSNTEETGEAEDKDVPTVEKFVLIAGYQCLIAELSALENSNEPEITWKKIKNELTPLIQNYHAPVLAAHSDESLKSQLESANQRIENLEKFKQLYFDLQSKLVNSVAEIEQLNQQIADLLEGSDNFSDILEIIEKNKIQTLNMGQMIGMDKEQHHESVKDKMDYSDELISERKGEIKRLKQQISQQFDEIWGLQSRLSNQAGENPNPAELNAGIETMTQNLKDAEMCIETMDMEIQTLTSEISNLRNQLKQQEATGSGSVSGATELEKVVQEKDRMIARFAQESKELMSCIIGLEDSSRDQHQIIEKLEDKLTKSSALEEKYVKLEANYSSMEAKYLEAMNQKNNSLQ